MPLLKIAAVSYLNTKPLLHGLLQDESLKEMMDIVLDYPANLVQKFASKSIQLALLPVASLLLFPGSSIQSKFGICSTNKVASVCIFSEVPITETSHLLLDYQSRTSILLAQILLKEYWQHSPKIVAADENFIKQIEGTQAGVVIGDRALELGKNFQYTYDLGEAWYRHTGLPFVFAAWISWDALPASFLEKFDAAQQRGLCDLAEVIRKENRPELPLQAYFEENISYEITPEAIEGLNLFLKKVKEHQLL